MTIHARTGRTSVATIILIALMFGPSTAVASSGVDDVVFVADEADAALAILAVQQRGQLPSASQWDSLFHSEGYQKLKRREESMKWPFSDADFRTFLTAPATIKLAAAWRAKLEEWKGHDVARDLKAARTYLPENASIRARVYALIKPRTNSFVFEGAIFLYVDSSKPAAEFDNTVTHELHHIGLSAACKKTVEPKVSSPVHLARVFIGGFGEGLAMLAAAGGPDVHPHAVSPSEDRARWDRDLNNFDTDLRAVERFLLDILDGRISTEEQAMKVAAPFWGVQGAWYTVGWKMATMIERAFGRTKLINDECDPVAFLSDYNKASERTASPQPARWSPVLLRRLADVDIVRP